MLNVILPKTVVKELKDTNTVMPKRHDQVTVLFCDIVGFTPYCDTRHPEQVLPHLRDLVEMWEEIAERHGVEKIKTVGDAFMAAAGLLQKTADDPVVTSVQCGLEMIAVCKTLPPRWSLRVGIHVGPVVAGVIGKRQYLFDLWGDTVNTAQRMESHGVADSVVLSEPAWKSIAHRARGHSIGHIPVNGKGALRGMEMFRFEEFK